MAFSKDKLVIDFKSLERIPVRDRVAIASSPLASEIFGNLTPSQIAALFPNYYKQEINAMAGQKSEFAAALSTVKSGGTGGGSGYNAGATSTGTDSSTGSAVPAPPVKPKTPEEIQVLLNKGGYKGEPNAISTGPTSATKDNNGRVISTATTNLTPAERALLDTIAIGNPNSNGYWESPDYNTIVNGGKFTSFHDHPRVFGTRDSTAAGRYQFTKTTWDDVVSRYNKSNVNNPITDFGPANQDRAALFLAKERYRSNTGRSLDEDLSNPPENFGDLIKSGLGSAGPGSFLTWEIFTRKNANEIGEAYNENYRRNTEYVKEIDAATDTIVTGENLPGTGPVTGKPLSDETGIVDLRKPFDESMLDLDPRLKQYWSTATNAQKDAIKKAIVDMGVEGVKDHFEKYPMRSAESIVNTEFADISNVEYGNLGDRNSPIDVNLQKKLSAMVTDVYGPDYKAVIYSGGEPIKGPKVSNSGRHDVKYDEEGRVLGGQAADVYIINKTTGEVVPRDQQIKAAQYWQSREFGGVGLGMKGGGIHLDQVQRGEAKGPDLTYRVWAYGKEGGSQQYLTPEERSAIEMARSDNFDISSITVSKPVTAEAKPLDNATAPQTQVAPVDSQTGGDVPLQPLIQKGGTPENPVPEQTQPTTEPPKPEPTATPVPANELGGKTELSTNPREDTVIAKKTEDGNLVPQATMGSDESAVIDKGVATVESSHEIKKDETNAKTEMGSGIKRDDPANQWKMQGRSTQPTNPFAQEMASGFAPRSPSAARAFEQIKKDRHWERGINGIDVA